MGLVRTKKRKKYSRMHGKNMGTAGHGARKKNKGSGHRGGFGMAGTGKRADQKKTLVQKLYGHNYFGKQGITSRKTEKDKRKRFNLRDVVLNLAKLGKKTEKGWQLDLGEHKVLGNMEIKEKIFITAKEASEGAIASIEKAGGKILLPKAENSED